MNKDVNKTIENEVKKKKKGGFLVMVVATLSASLLENMLAGSNLPPNIFFNKIVAKAKISD